jgi:hypothetical protein
MSYFGIANSMWLSGEPLKHKVAREAKVKV